MNIECWTAGPFQDDQHALLTTLKEILTQAFPHAPFRHVDVCEQWLQPLGRTSFGTIVPLLQEWLPSLLAQLQTQPDLPQPWLETLWQMWDTDALSRALNERPDDTILFCCHPIATVPLLLEKQRRCSDPTYQPPLVVWLTNHYQFDLDRLHPGISAHIVPHPDIANAILETAPERPVLALPRPLHPAFDAPPHRAAQKQQFQLEHPTVLIHAAHIPEGERLPFFFQLSLVQTPVHWLFSYGDDNELADALRQYAEHTGIDASMFGQQEHLQPFLAAADWVIGRPTPQHIAESLRCHTPMLAWPPLPGSQTGDVDYLTAKGVMHTIDRIERLGVLLETHLQPDAIERTHKAIAAFAPSPQPPSSIYAKVAAELLQHRTEQQTRERVWLQERIIHRSSPASPRASSSSPKPPPPATAPASATTSSSSTTASGKAAWKEAYAHVLLQEKKLQREIEQNDDEIAAWEDRLEQANNHHDEELRHTCTQQLDKAKQTRRTLMDSWRDIQEQKESLRATPGTQPAPSDKPATHKSASPKQTPAPASREQNIDEQLAALKAKMTLNRSNIDLSQLKDEKDL